MALFHADQARVVDAEHAGHNSCMLLAEAAARRQLATADSISDVLYGACLRRTADLLRTRRPEQQLGSSGLPNGPQL